jgi:hypothetical protein
MSTTKPASAGISCVAIVARDGQSGDAARAFVEQLGLQAVPVETSGSGSVVAELDGLRELDFAIVTLSAADLGEGSRSAFLSIGFLLGVLPQGRLCCLLADQSAPVPELDGMPRHTMDAGGLWRLLLAREMRQAGLNVDMNKAL